MNNKALPHDLQIETNLLGAMILDNKKIIDAFELIENDFYNASNKILFKTIIEMYKKDIDIDIATLSNVLGDKLQGIGGITKLAEITSSAFSTNVKSYVKILKELSLKRNIIASCNKAIKQAYSKSDSKDILNEMQSSFIEQVVASKEKTCTITETLLSTTESIEENHKNGGKITGISTGYRKLDNAINGLVKKDVIVIAARPSMGKTAFALNILKNLNRENKAVLFELEMSKEKLGARLLAAKAGINATDLPRGNIKESDFTKMMKVANHYSLKDNLYINDNNSMTIYDIKAECKRLKITHGLDIVVIDHLGYIKPVNPNLPKVQQIGEITKEGKTIAKELDVTVIFLSQLSRAVETRPDKHPQLSDLRDSGNIEEDADTVLFLYRDDYYAERERRESEKPGCIEIGIGKQRDGEAGWLDLKFIKEYQLITEEFFN
ncbi:replicative DNA helicase [Clostridium sporogenes]|uniref:replicative DNA helicase n=1 Tax=Clostridium sporogenes TaxID=1509 RepID=UPI0015EF0C92|nr:replicative DNA helicase [Clostridium sporogenes]MBA4509768.1 replicative DNA helicase [Clostridium sporogenes]